MLVWWLSLALVQKYGFNHQTFFRNSNRCGANYIRWALWTIPNFQCSRLFLGFLVHQHLISYLNFSANNSLLFQYFQISFVILELLTKSWMCQRIKRLKKGYLLSIEWSVQLWIDWKMVMKLLKALLNKCMKNFQIF